MAYDARLPRAIDRIRLEVGDIETPEWLPDATYETLYADVANDLAAAKVAAYDALIAVIAQRPVRSSAEGITEDYSARIPLLRARRDALASQVTTVAGSPFTTVPAVFRTASSTDEYSR